MSQFLGLIGCLCNLAFALRLNVKYGIDDLTFVILLSIFGETTALAFTLLPTLVLFAKITPHHIEATVFALLTGTYNLANNVGSPLIGSFFCKWYGVDSNHLDKYSDLIIIQIVAVCFGFLYIFLVPKRKEIDALLMQEI
jgi:membrane protein DedA with SNARE-associated domain